MRVMPCSTCSRTVELNTVKYYTADQQHVFCDAYWSNEWYTKTFEKLNAKKDQTKNDK